MLQFAGTKLADMRLLASQLGKMMSPPELANEPHRVAMLTIVEQMVETVDELNLPLSAISLRKVKDELEEPNPRPFASQAIKGALDEFHGRFLDELSSRVFLALDADTHDYCGTKKPAVFGQSVHDAFPSSRFDISEAGKCFALSRYTACVMHLMRSLEPALRVQAADLGIQMARDNWGNILPTMEGKINDIKGDPEKKEFHSGAATQFTFIKNAWRDAAMHQRGVYGEDDAAPIMAATKGLLRQLAKKLHE